MTEQEAIKSIENDLEQHSKELKPKYKEVLKFAIKCIEKQIPKKPTIDEFDYGEGYVCAKCEEFLHYVEDDDEHRLTNYCRNCGTKIDWGNEDAE
jgi:DNA-directed RNA polymerase subunit RPC12/RpoP